MTTTQTIAEFVAKYDITMSVRWTDSNPNMADDVWARTANHYKCTLRHGRKRWTTYFSQGSGITGEPSAIDLLGSLASDCSSVDQSFEDWCGDYGYDSDSRKALKTYRACQRYSVKLKALLGDALYAELLACEPD